MRHRKTVTAALGTVAALLLAVLAPANAQAAVPAPSVTALSLSTGKTVGGAALTLRGHNLTAVRGVLFGRYWARRVRVLNSSTITLITPPNIAARVDVRVVGRYGTSRATRADWFTYLGAPAIGRVSPAALAATGGSTVTITGASFTGLSAVWFGTARGTSLRLRTATTLTVVAPAHPAGIVNLRVVTAYGTSRPVAVRYVSTPVHPAPVSTVTLLHATAAATGIQLNWRNPADATLTGVLIRRNSGTVPPAGPTAGTAVAQLDGLTSSMLDANLTPATTYSYSVFTLHSGGRYGRPVTLAATTLPAAAPVTLVSAPPAPTTVVTTPGQLQSVTGASGGAQQVGFTAGATLPQVGDTLVSSATPSSPNGLLATVTALIPNADGSTTAITKPARMADAYPTFAIAYSHHITATDLPKRAAPRMRAAAEGQPTGPSAGQPAGPAAGQPEENGTTEGTGDEPWRCTDESGAPLSQTVTLGLEVDLSSMNVHYSASYGLFSGPQMSLEVTGQPEVVASLGLQGAFTCTFEDTNLGILIPVFGPVMLDLTPKFSIKASGAISVIGKFKPKLDVGFSASGSGVHTIDTFDTSDKSLGVRGSVTASVYVALDTRIEIANRLSIGGDFGPALTGSLVADTTSPDANCMSLSVGGQVGFSADADLWVEDWKFAIESSAFGNITLWKRCSNGPVIATSTPPAGQVGQPYSYQLRTADNRPGTWAVLGGALPDGLKLEPDTGVITGVPTTEGAQHVTIGFTDEAGQDAELSTPSIQIQPAPVPTPTPTPTPAPTSTSSGNGSVYWWGSTPLGSDVIINGGPATINTTPTQIAGVANAKQAVLVDDGLTLYLKQDGTVWAVGYDTSGLMGNGSTGAEESTDVPVQVPGLTNVTQLAGAGTAAFALRADGTVWVWGYSVEGLTGSGPNDGSTGVFLEPQQVQGVSGITQLTTTTAAQTVYALDGAGTVYTWGSNANGEQGLGSGATGAGINVVPLPAPATKIWGTDTAGYAALDDGSLYTWGTLALSQPFNPAGSGTAFSTNYVPSLLIGVNNAISVSSDGNALYVVERDGTVWQSLANTDPSGPTLTPFAQVPGLSGISSLVSDNSGANYALTATGQLYDWGSNLEGQLGNGQFGDSTPIPTPTLVSGLPPITQVAAAGASVIAVAG